MSADLQFYDIHQHVGDSSQSHGTHGPGPTVDAVDVFLAARPG